MISAEKVIMMDNQLKEMKILENIRCRSMAMMIKKKMAKVAKFSKNIVKRLIKVERRRKIRKMTKTVK